MCVEAGGIKLEEFGIVRWDAGWCRRMRDDAAGLRDDAAGCGMAQQDTGWHKEGEDCGVDAVER